MFCEFKKLMNFSKNCLNSKKKNSVFFLVEKMTNWLGKITRQYGFFFWCEISHYYEFLLKKGNILLQETFFFWENNLPKKEQVHPIFLGCRR
jgi:hypothetical protein